MFDKCLAWRVRKIISKLAEIAESLLLNQPDRLDEWKSVISNYINIMEIAFQHQDFSKEEVEDFQDLVDECFFFVC